MKAVAATCVTIMALIFSWIPVLNLFAFALAFLLITFQYISYPQTRRGIGFREGARFLRLHPFACLGFGLSVSFLFAIPVVSAFVLPVAVVGGTLLVARAPGNPDGRPGGPLLPPLG